MEVGQGRNVVYVVRSVVPRCQVGRKEDPLDLVLLYIQVVLLQLDAKKSPLALILLYIQVVLLQLEVPLDLVLLYIQVELLQCAAKKSPLALMLYIQDVLLWLEVPLALCAAKKTPLALMLYIQDVLLQLEVPLALVLYIQVVLLQLDAKKSPLALLAQTCSQIGADSPNTKTLIPTLEKPSKSKSDTPRDKSSPASSSSNNSNNSNNSNSSACEVVSRSSFKPYESLRDQTVSPDTRTPATSKSLPLTRCSSNQSAPSPRSSPAVMGRKTPAVEAVVSPSKVPVSDCSSVPSPSTKMSDSSMYKPGSLYYPGPPFPLDLMTSSILSQHPLKQGMNPYIGYARMKTPSGGDALVAVCRDPYCTGCHLLTGKSPCPGGCVQCDHASKAGLLSASSPGVAAVYAHAQLAALAAASHLPYVCSWVAGDAAYCGKRFSSSEELLQHLRTHTNLTSETSAAALSLLSPPSSHPLFHRTYPTPPLSPLATARYHPYNKPPLLPPSLGFPLHPHPGIPPYFSPYSLYGQRLGASPAMHP
uniref:C2H2-type domain-containing protein n=1 Tax=Timema tahoe TaxID=61484 RepID=A0A7R9ILT9_9NEOP|nr:unnamed protein product [Timema tahoe]